MFEKYYAMTKFFSLLIIFIIILFKGEAQTNRLELQKSREPVEKDTILWGNYALPDSLWHIHLKPVEIVKPYVAKNKRKEKKLGQF